jgi:hypothetical protein
MLNVDFVGVRDVVIDIFVGFIVYDFHLLNETFNNLADAWRLGLH